MARNNDRNRVVMVSLAYSPKGVGAANLLRDFCIGASLAIGNRKQRVPAFFLEFGADKLHLTGKLPQLASKIGLDLLFVGAKLLLRLDPDFVLAFLWSLAFVENQETQTLAGSRKQQFTRGRFHPGVIDGLRIVHM